MTINGEPVEVPSGPAYSRFSHEVTLAPGRNLFTIEVTAPDGETNRFYRELLHIVPEE